MSESYRRPRKPDPDRMKREPSSDERDAISANLDAQAARADSQGMDRDVAALARDDVNTRRESGSEVIDAPAAIARYWALRDRLGATVDRLRAANMRIHAQADRFDSAADRHTTSIDALTGSYLRDAGLHEIARDLGSSRRVGQSLLLGFLDVDGLKRTNDQKGHAAGDAALKAVSATLRSKLREYDLTVRYGGDEFLFSVVGASETDGRTLIESVNLALRSAGHNTVTCGIVRVSRTETLTSAINRADALLYEQRVRDSPDTEATA